MGISFSIVSALIYCALVLAFFVIRVCICLYVYRDANNRGKEALLWVLVVFFAPVLGVVLYLILRNEEAKKQNNH